MKILENNAEVETMFERKRNTTGKCKALALKLIELSKTHKSKMIQATIQELINAKTVKNGDVFAIANAHLNYDELKTYQKARLTDQTVRSELAKVIKRINFLDKSSDVSQIVVEFK